MTRPVLALIVGAVLGNPVAWLTPAAVSQTDTTIFSGVYSTPQAARGKEIYIEKCGYCHRDDLSGGGSEAGAPALKGPSFTTRWNNQPLGEMFVTIGTTMPKNEPDTMRPADVADVVAFLLEANDMPAGNNELPPDMERLMKITFSDRR